MASISRLGCFSIDDSKGKSWHIMGLHTKNGVKTNVYLKVTLTLSDKVLEYLQQEAHNRKLPLNEVINDVLVDYFDDPTHDELLAGLERSLQQVIAGEYRLADEFLDEIEREMGTDALDS